MGYCGSIRRELNFRSRSCSPPTPIRNAWTRPPPRSGSAGGSSSTSAPSIYRASRSASTSSSRSSSWPNTSASSTAIPAPEARCGVVAWQASPISTARPRCQGRAQPRRHARIGGGEGRNSGVDGYAADRARGDETWRVLECQDGIGRAGRGRQRAYQRARERPASLDRHRSNDDDGRRHHHLQCKSVKEQKIGRSHQKECSGRSRRRSEWRNDAESLAVKADLHRRAARLL